MTSPDLENAPFTVTVARHALGQNGGQVVFNPMSGSDSRSIPLTTGGIYDMTIDWHVQGYVVPGGNSSLGFDSYSIAWAIVPEPSALMLAVLGFVGVVAMGRSRADLQGDRQRAD